MIKLEHIWTDSFFTKWIYKEYDSKPRLIGEGDSIYCNKNCVGYLIEIIVCALKTITLGANFELYSMFIEHLQHIQKIKRFHLSDSILAAFFS